MAIDYEKLFTAIGSVVNQVSVFEGYYADLNNQYTGIKTALDDGNFSSQVSSLATNLEERKSAVLGWILELKNKVVEILLDRVNVREELGVGDSTDIDTILRLLIADMVANGESVSKCQVTFLTRSRTVNNTNAGDVGFKARLDGVTRSHDIYAANLSYTGLVSQMAEQDIMRLVCDRDSFSGNTKGAESFSLKGRPRKSNPFSWETPGSGTCYETITSVQNRSLFDLDFDTFTNDIPSGWTVVSGGSNVSESTTDGVSGRTVSLELAGDGSTEIVLTCDASSLEAGKAYAFGVWVQDENGMSDGTLTIELAGTGASFSSGEKIIVEHSDLTTGVWTLVHTVAVVPLEKPDDLVLKITLSADATDNMLLSYGGIAAPTYWNGLAIYLFDGDEAFVKGDEFQVKPLNDNAGTFQVFFRRAFGVQLPSSDTPTISDSWGT